MHVEAALRAVEDEVFKLTLEVGLTCRSSSRSIFAWTVTG